MKILAVDTALSAVSACVLDEGSDSPDAIETLAMARGHAEALLPLIGRVVARVEGGFASLGRVAVTVGPGSFTGLRTGIAAARAIGIACKIPVAGVSTFAALAAPLILEQKPGLVATAIDAGRGNVFFAAFGRDGRAVLPPRIAPAREAVRALGTGPVRLTGSGAPLLASEALAAGTETFARENAGLDIVFVAKLGLLADPSLTPPRPFYLAPPGAKTPEAPQLQPAAP
ncbi:MAG: tRNA (adenosine(37)-N6)-threonylcarbamoyltransferase complex dimerization subunit type 1 TsaB [Beijerinckiaceae bacterium]